jgi:protein SCO1/2
VKLRLPTLFVALASAGMAGCATHSPHPAATAACCATAEAPTAFSDKSLYQLDSLWTTDEKRQIKLTQLSGRPQVVAMFFANCQVACPIIVNDLKRIEATLPAELRARVGFVLVSFDSKRDTPAALADYRRARKLPAERWALLRGSPDDVLELAALLGIKYKEDARGQFAHSNVITILNAQGEIVHQQIGLNQDVYETVRSIQQAAARQPSRR